MEGGEPQKTQRGRKQSLKKSDTEARAVQL
jgi:hypothetical protein